MFSGRKTMLTVYSSLKTTSAKPHNNLLIVNLASDIQDVCRHTNIETWLKPPDSGSYRPRQLPVIIFECISQIKEKLNKKFMPWN